MNGVQAASSTQQYTVLRQCVLSAAQCLAPEALGAAFSFRPHHLRGFSASGEQHKVLGFAVLCMGRLVHLLEALSALVLLDACAPHAAAVRM